VSPHPQCGEGEGYEGDLPHRLGLPLVVSRGDGESEECERNQQEPHGACPRPSAQTDASGERENDDGREGEHDEPLSVTGKEQLGEDQHQERGETEGELPLGSRAHDGKPANQKAEG